MSNDWKIVEISGLCLQTEPCQHACVCESPDGERKDRLLSSHQIIAFGHEMIVNNRYWLEHFAYLDPALQDQLKKSTAPFTPPVVQRIEGRQPPSQRRAVQRCAQPVPVTLPSPESPRSEMPKTRFIAHRGNLDGPDPATENHPAQIDRVLAMGHDCEIDLRRIKEELWLGHDKPQYQVTREWLQTHHKHLWIHCKNHAALEWCLRDPNLNCFWHQNDDYTLTSQGFIWAYPGQSGGKSTVAVMPETTSPPHALSEYYAVCSDYADICANTSLKIGDRVLVKSRGQIGEVVAFVNRNSEELILVEFSNGEFRPFPVTDLQKTV